MRARGARGVKLLREFENDAQFNDYMTEYEQRHLSDRQRIDAMMRYGSTAQCRWDYLSRYLESAVVEGCKSCDNCVRAAAQPPGTPRTRVPGRARAPRAPAMAPDAPTPAPTEGLAAADPRPAAQ